MVRSRRAISVRLSVYSALGESSKMDQCDSSQVPQRLTFCITMIREHK